MIKILVVEDERPISDLIRMNLEDAGYQLRGYEDIGSSCTASAEEIGIDREVKDNIQGWISIRRLNSQGIFGEVSI